MSTLATTVHCNQPSFTPTVFKVGSAAQHFQSSGKFYVLILESTPDLLSWKLSDVCLNKWPVYTLADSAFAVKLDSGTKALCAVVCSSKAHSALRASFFPPGQDTEPCLSDKCC